MNDRNTENSKMNRRQFGVKAIFGATAFAAAGTAYIKPKIDDAIEKQRQINSEMLLKAIKNRDRAEIDRLIECDFDPNINTYTDISAKKILERGLLSQAVMARDIETVQKLIEKGANGNLVDYSNCTPLYLAVILLVQPKYERDHQKIATIAEILGNSFPESLKDKASASDTPLDILINNNHTNAYMLLKKLQENEIESVSPPLANVPLVIKGKVESLRNPLANIPIKIKLADDFIHMGANVGRRSAHFLAKTKMLEKEIKDISEGIQSPYSEMNTRTEVIQNSNEVSTEQRQ